MATYTSLINSVLRRLREDEVAGPTSTDYSQLIGDFVNEVKREVEDAWKWHSLRQQVQVTTAASTNGYSITGAGKRYKFTDDRRRAYDATNYGWIWPRDSVILKRNLLTASSTGLPMSYYIEGIDSSGDPKVYFYSLPDGVYTINFELVIPQDDFSVGTEELSVPKWPVVLGAYAKAVAERGEDQGRTHGEVFSAYNLALGDAIALDNVLTSGEDVWYVQ